MRLRDQALMSRLTPSGDESTAEVLLRRQCIVRLATQRQILRRFGASVRERIHVVKLQSVCFAAPSTGVVEVGAARLVTLVDGAPHGCGHVTPALARSRSRVWWRI